MSIKILSRFTINIISHSISIIFLLNCSFFLLVADELYSDFVIVNCTNNESSTKILQFIQLKSQLSYYVMKER